jgi:hypothetical protein
MQVKLCDLNPAAESQRPERTDDKSGVAVHYVDAWIKPLNTQLDDGTAVKCKRRGLKITLTVGSKKGEGLLRRLEYGPDPDAMLAAALREAAQAAEIGLQVEAGAVYLSL